MKGITTDTPAHIISAITQAKKEKIKGVRAFIDGWEENSKLNELIFNGKLEIYVQKYEHCGFKMSCLLLKNKS